MRERKKYVKRARASSSSRATLAWAAAAMAGVTALAASTSHAALMAGDSSGYGLYTNIKLGAPPLLGVQVNVGPTPSTMVSGTAPGAYNVTNSLALATVTSNLAGIVGANVGAGLVSGSASSNIDGAAGQRYVYGAGGVVNANIAGATLPVLGGGVNVLSLNGTLSSTAMLSGQYSGAITATGTTTIESLSLKIGAITIPLNAFVGATVAPNTQVDLSVLGLAGVSLILNEQILSADHTSLAVNALHLDINASVAGIGTDAEVILGHSQAEITSATANVVPEPATAGLLAPVPALLLRRRRRGGVVAGATA